MAYPARRSVGRCCSQVRRSTPETAKAQLRFRDGATISLQPGTQFRVEQFRFSEQGGKADEQDTVVMRLLKGTLRAVSGLIGKEKREQYRMDTTVGTIGIRGTEYGASLGDPGLAVTTYAGLVEVCNTAGCAMAGAGQTLQVPDANTRPRLLPGSNLPNLTPGRRCRNCRHRRIRTCRMRRSSNRRRRHRRISRRRRAVVARAELLVWKDAGSRGNMVNRFGIRQIAVMLTAALALHAGVAIADRSHRQGESLARGQQGRRGISVARAAGVGTCRRS